VLNGADPDAPTPLQISRAIGALMHHEWHEVLLPGAEIGPVGDHPWNDQPPGRVFDMAAARQLGYVAAGSYAELVGETVDWLVAATRNRDWREVMRDFHYLEPLFDYAAEDAYLAELGRT
jgi:hypothetical protein